MRRDQFPKWFLFFRRQASITALDENGSSSAHRPDFLKTLFRLTSELSAIAAAAHAHSETGRAMTCPVLIEAMAAGHYWTSTGGKTPAPLCNRDVTLCMLHSLSISVRPNYLFFSNSV
jgi:hypothetical protein